MSYTQASKETLTLDLLRHITLNTLYSLKVKLIKYGPEIVVAFDNRNYWRRDYFPLYKKHRQKEHDKSDFDWDLFFEFLNVLKDEFRDTLPFKILEVDRAEADDVCAVLSQEFGENTPICISSSDKDFLQLQTDTNKVVQYSPWHKKFLTKKTTEYDLFEHIIRGDAGDSIPNFLSDEDTFLDDTKRQKQISAKKLAIWKEYESVPEYFCESIDILKRFETNKKIIDLSLIPDEIRESILTAYHNTQPNKGKFFSYCAKHKLTKIMERYL